MLPMVVCWVYLELRETKVCDFDKLGNGNVDSKTKFTFDEVFGECFDGH